MKVKDLIERLESFHDNMFVVVKNGSDLIEPEFVYEISTDALSVSSDKTFTTSTVVVIE